MEPFLRRDACQNRGAGGGDNEHRRCPPHTDRGADTDTNGGTYAYAHSGTDTYTDAHGSAYASNYAHSHADDSARDADTHCFANCRTYHGTDSPAYCTAYCRTDSPANARPVADCPADTHTVAQPGDTKDCRRA